MVASPSTSSSTTSSFMGSRMAITPIRRVTCRALVAVSAAAAAAPAETEEKPVQRLLGIYQQKVVPGLQEEYKYGNKFEVGTNAWLCCFRLNFLVGFTRIVWVEGF
jgi:hypothetical protein